MRPQGAENSDTLTCREEEVKAWLPLFCSSVTELQNQMRFKITLLELFQKKTFYLRTLVYVYVYMKTEVFNLHSEVCVWCVGVGIPPLAPV